MSEIDELLTEDGRWVLTCDCGNVIRQKDLAYRSSSSDPCESCRKVLAGEDEMIDQPSVARELGWCGCGDPERVNEMMLSYLSNVPIWEHPEHGLSTGELLLLSYLADSVGWTDHGTVVTGAWLTPEGELVRDRLASTVASTGPVDNGR